MSSLEKFPSFDAAAFERDQATSSSSLSRRAPRSADFFAPGGVFGDGRLEMPWRFPSPYAPVLPLDPDARPIPLDMDHNARYAMGLPSHHGKNYRHDDEDVDDGDAATITPATCHQEEHRRRGHDAGPGTKLPTYRAPLTPADENSGRSVYDHVVHHSLEVLKTRDASPLSPAAVAYRQSDPFVEKNPPVRPLQQQPRAPTPTTLAYGLGPTDARLQLPSQRFAVSGGGGEDPTPTRPAAASRAPTQASLLGGEPGPDVGPAARRRATPQDLHHFVGFDDVGGGTEDRGRPSSHHHHRRSRSSGGTTTPPSPLSASQLSLSSRRVTGSVATVRDLRAMAPPHRQISIRSLVRAPSAGGLDDRQIIVTNALNHILYDGPCRHCEVNHCVCLLPASATPLSPQATPANAQNDNNDFAALFSTAVPQPQHQPPDNDIMTEGFCRHCVVNHCACVNDAKWGLHHAANALRNARLDENYHRYHDDPTARRLVSDSGTVRRYESTSIEAADDGDRDAIAGSRCALRTGSSSASPPPFAAPLPAYLPMGRERISSVDDGGGGFYDLEAQPHRRDGSSGGSGSGRGMVSSFHFRHSFRPGGTDPGVLGGRRTRTRRSRVAEFVAGHLCRIFVAVIFVLLIAVMAWVVWFYTNRDGVPIT